jgi:ABC-type multidrug transport system fused ATPase/permease subunit
MERVLPNASVVAANGPALVACFGAPVGLFLVYDAFVKKRQVNFEELEWKRREVQRASIKLREVVKGERTKNYLDKLGAGGEGTVRLTFTLNVGGYSEAALREELERLFEVDSSRLLLVEDTLDEGGREEEGGDGGGDGANYGEAKQPQTHTLVRSNSVQVLVAKLTAQLKEQLTEKGAKISQAFQMVDQNGEGSITAEDFALGLADVGLDMKPDDVAALVASIDGDGDGRISLHEWTVAFGPRQVTVAILPEVSTGDEGAEGAQDDGDGASSNHDNDADDPDVTARQLKKKLTKLGKSSEKDQTAAEDADEYPLLSTVETQVSPVQTEVNELKWTEAKRIYKWRREASHKRFRDVEIAQNAAELRRKDVALGKATATLEDKVAALRHERDEVDALLLQATQLTWRSLRREVSECVMKMTDKEHAEHEKFRDGKAIKELLRLVRRERKRMVRTTFGKGPRAFIVRHLDYYGLIDRKKWCPNLVVGPSREELVTAVNAVWEKKKEQYGRLGVLMQLASSDAPTLILGTLFNTLSGAITPLTLKFKSDMIRALERLDSAQAASSFSSLIYVQFIIMFIDNLSNRFTRKGADAVSQKLKRLVGRAIISQDLRYFDSVDQPSKCLRDAEEIEHDLVYQPQYVIKRAVGLVSNFIVAYDQSPELLKFMAIVLPVTQVVQTIVIGWFRKSTKRQQRGRMTNDDSLGMESVTRDSESMKVVRSFGRELRTVEEYSASNEVQDDLQQQSDLLLDLLNPIFRFSHQIGTYLGLYYGMELVLQSKMSASDVAIAVSLSENLVHGVKSFFRRELPALARVLAPATRIIEMLDRTPTQGVDEDIGLTPAKPLTGVIEFKDVHFAYPRDKNKKVLRGLSFKMSAGESLGIVGSAGCGKSTALAVLLRMYDCQSGQVLIDGRDIKVRKTASFFEFSLCLSRACLGKMIVSIYKWLKNAVFRRTTTLLGYAGKQNPFFAMPLYTRLKRSFLPRRLGTDIEKVEKSGVVLQADGRRPADALHRPR